MPIHQIRANDGSIIEVEAPANTPPDQVLQLAKKQQLSAQIEAKKIYNQAGIEYYIPPALLQLPSK